MRAVSQDNMLKGNLWTSILVFAIPLILSNLLQVLFNISDVAVIGQFASANSLGAVGCTTNLVALFTSFLSGMGLGVNAVVAKLLGSQNNEKIKKAVHTGFIACGCVGIAVLILGMTCSKYMLILMQTKEAFIDKSTLYMTLYFIGAPATAIFNFGNGVYSAYGDTRKPLIFLSIGGVLNIGLNLLFTIVFKMDVAGVAIASFISQYLSASLVIISLIRNKGSIHFSFKNLKIDKECNKRILSLGLTSGLQQSLFAIANVVIQSGVNSLDEVMVEGIAAAQNSDVLVWDTMAAFYTAASSFIGQNYGAYNKERVKKVYFITLLYSVLTGAVLGGILLLLRYQFLSVFTSDSEVIEAGIKRLFIMALSYWMSGFMDNSIAASRGLGKTLVPTIVVILGSVFFRIVWVYTIFAYFGSVESLFLLYIFSWAITAVFEIGYFMYSFRKAFKRVDVNEQLD